ncbi:hypothetical protein OG458_23895 [Streptomyces sp. NBC_01281]|uniref:hypothetical protein n=1 Tax=Streptomyces sp. NBC_01281 TaxID=2903811 RepID=UPI002E0D26E1|nr:hypothetical protein OG458_23895 [Streptomyces sp. NBC_01281]
MTQSGQGEEPSARPAREGIVLPSDGGEPLLPGTTGDRAVPAGGQAWGRPWGPDQPAGPPPRSGDGWGAQGQGGQTWAAPEQSGSAPSAQEWGTATPADSHGAQGWQQPSGAGPLPPEGAQSSYGGQDGYGHGTHGAHGAGATGGYDAYDGYGAADGQQGSHARHGRSDAQPAPLPPAADEGATQYIPYIPAGPGGDEGATQFIPPVPAAPDEGATQYIPPVGPGALPPEVQGADATRYLGRTPQDGSGSLPPAGGSDADPTQFMAPVPAQPADSYGVRPGAPEERQPPAEFDNLFRSEPDAPPSTQQLPRFDPAAPAPHGAHDPYGTPSAPDAPGAYAPAGRAAARRGGPSDHDGQGGGGRSRSRVPLIAAVGIGIVVLGIGAGALLSGGGDDDAKGDTGKTVSATAPASKGSSAPAADPVKAQAVELDKLLADSTSSRDSVIKAVGDVKACRNLDQAAGSLRDAAKQRGELVTRLSGLTVDKLPDNAGLTAALTSGWKASASADNHYAAWADQAKGRKGCHKNQARTTGQTLAGNQASGTASAQKEKAARLWNSIASKYGLTQRTRTQL